MDNEKLFDFMTRMYSEMQEGFKKLSGEISTIKGELTEVKEEVSTVKGELTEVKEEVSTVKGELAEVKFRLTSVENIVTRIEHDHGQKLQVLFDGYKQHTDQLERIEKELTRHDEFIMKRIK